MDDSLLKAVENWPARTGINDVQKILGLTGYYGNPIKGYAGIARPISDLIRSHDLRWESKQKSPFQELNEAITSRPVLALPRIGMPFKVSGDA